MFKETHLSNNRRAKNFPPNLDLKSSCHQLYSCIENQNSHYLIKVVFIKRSEKGYEGLIRMSSKSKTCLITGVNENLNDLVKDLYNQFSEKH